MNHHPLIYQLLETRRGGRSHDQENAFNATISRLLQDRESLTQNESNVIVDSLCDLPCKLDGSLPIGEFRDQLCDVLFYDGYEDQENFMNRRQTTTVLLQALYLIKDLHNDRVGLDDSHKFLIEQLQLILKCDGRGPVASCQCITNRSNYVVSE